MGSVDAVVVYLRGLPSREKVLQKLSPRDPSQPWVIASFEAPSLANGLFRTVYHTLGGIFNRTMLYRRDADVVVPHGFIVPREDANLLPPPWRIPSLPYAFRNHSSRKPAVAFISNCKAISGRQQYIKELQKYIQVINSFSTSFLYPWRLR